MKSQSGQTLLESLIAIAIILIGVVSLATLLTNIISTSRTALAETRVTQLAQEALEGARYVRDSNWLKREDGTIEGSTGYLRDYANGLRDSSGDTTAIYVWNSTSSATPDTAITFNFTTNDINNDDSARVYQDSNGYFRQITGTMPGGWKTTGFRRLVTFQLICLDITSTTETVSSSACDSSAIEVGIQVTATIQWISQGAKTQRSFNEKLYNWKYADPQAIP